MRRRARERSSVYLIFLNFCIISLLHLFSKVFLFGERAQLQSPRCSVILPPTELACNTHPPPHIFSWVAKCPCARTGSAGKHACAQASLCVSVVRDSEGDGRVTPAHMRVCAPGLRSWVRVSTHSYPGGRAGGYPQVRRPWGPARDRDAGTRCLGTCVYPYAAETRVLG